MVSAGSMEAFPVEALRSTQGSLAVRIRSIVSFPGLRLRLLKTRIIAVKLIDPGETGLVGLEHAGVMKETHGPRTFKAFSRIEAVWLAPNLFSFYNTSVRTKRSKLTSIKHGEHKSNNRLNKRCSLSLQVPSVENCRPSELL